jgi:hypothetical protein
MNDSREFHAHSNAFMVIDYFIRFFLPKYLKVQVGEIQVPSAKFF